MASLPYRYQEILTALRDNPQGLTTGQVFDICHKQRGSELPNSTITGQCIYALRNNSEPRISTSDGDGGSVHKITRRGMQLLADALGEPFEMPNPAADEKPIEPEPVVQSSPQPAPIAASEPNDPDDEKAAMPDVGPDLLSAFDDAAFFIRKCIMDIMAPPESPVKIRDKSRKMAVVDRLEPLFSTDIADMIAAIRADLELLESE